MYVVCLHPQLWIIEALWGIQKNMKSFHHITLYHDFSENIEIKRHINRHFTLVYLLGITTVDMGTGEEPYIHVRDSSDFIRGHIVLHSASSLISI